MRGIVQRIAHPLSCNRENVDTEDFWALKNINLEIRKGDRLGIIGGNGAGKSTLLKILSRITEPTTGTVRMSGRVSSLLEVGTGFHPELTGRENIFLNGSILGMKRAEIKSTFDEIVTFADIEKFLDTPVKRYSSGMYVRLAFAVAAHLDPEILIVDEVLAVGDVQFQKKCIGKMREAGSEGRTVIFVSHNMAAIDALCQTAVQLDRGELVKYGSTREVLDNYLSHRSGASDSHCGYIVHREVLSQQNCDVFEFEDVGLNNPRAPSAGPCTGDPLHIRARYRSSRTLSPPSFVCSIRNANQQELIRLSTTPISGFPIERLYRTGDIELDIDSLPLVAGRYFVDIGFVREASEWVSRLENVIEFQVYPRDVYHSGLALDESRGMFVVDHRWQHTEVE
jgi:lipopolysaccharide transport system ATP-binding protein